MAKMPGGEKDKWGSTRVFNIKSCERQKISGNCRNHVA